MCGGGLWDRGGCISPWGSWATFLGEPLGAGLFVGLAVILGGVWLVIGPRRAESCLFCG